MQQGLGQKKQRCQSICLRRDTFATGHCRPNETTFYSGDLRKNAVILFLMDNFCGTTIA
ncbi:hypothetical protein HF289_11865 [Acidithiobacillus ferrooxidans]|uniref:hypothetical protein n=1 Tax=Acidithiobacillus ferrooxidans TaxID=920 RepID=UPI0013D7FD5B|nr:hypothetical protein [Acidithiobacillus ferrooxidans]MBU2857535.1 hypothetical protein [Acidithiobacillus ferrooxidans]MBU2859837.1 hypothetical protein [Acidithiobacillus ferrooxidans]MCR2829434.1 hypothetical protein [Acidithiobacillus ferrooxidans]